MKLTVVGCSGSLPGPDGPASCYLVEADGFRIVVDLGNGAVGPLQRFVDLRAVDAVLLSHLHPDHCLDMCAYYVALKYHPGGASRRVPVYGPAGTADQLAAAYGVAPDPGLHTEFAFTTWTPGTTRIGPFVVTVARVHHPVEAYGIRLEHGGRVITYSGDTDSCIALTELARGADLFLCEASFHEGRDAQRDLHLTGRRAGEPAAAASVRRLVLTHLPPWNDPDRAVSEAATAYGGPVDVARPGTSYDV